MDKPILLDVPHQLVGDRIVTRPFRDGDAQTLYEAIEESRDHIRPWLPWTDMHASVSDTVEFIRRSSAQATLRESFGMGIFARDTGGFLGGVGLHPRDWRIPSFEIGYWIRRAEQGKGYVSEATKLVTQLAFEHLGAQRVFIRCDTENSRSKAIPERLGFMFEGIMRHAFFNADGDVRNVLTYSMIPEEYESVKSRW